MADYFTYQNKEYLLIYDTFSKYPFAFKVTSKTVQSFTQTFKDLISQYRAPKHIFTNNRPPFSSEELTNFMHKHQTDHITSLPLYQQPTDSLRGR